MLADAAFRGGRVGCGRAGCRTVRAAHEHPDRLGNASLSCDDFEEFTALAESLVEQSTGLRSLAGPARAQVSTREEWIHANVSSFRRLLGPVLERAGKSGRGFPGALGPVGRTAAGAELGVVLGWMSGRVLGQYDLLFADDESPQDAVYYVGPNIVSLERRHGSIPGSSGSGSRCTN